MYICGYDVKAFRARYGNGNLAVVLNTADTNEPYGSLTVNISPLPSEDLAAIDTNNIPEAENFIISNKLGEFTGRMLQSGFCMYPVYKFYLNKLD